MTQLLIRLFIKNPEEIGNEKVRSSYGILGSSVGIIANVVLFILKLIIGMLAASVAITADAFNNLSDAVSSVISLIGVKWAERPADKEHPFGHGRIEYIITMVVALIVIILGFSFMKESYNNIINEKSVRFSWIIIICLLLSILVKIWLSVFNRKLGKKINSGILIASGMDAMSDVLATSVTVVAMVVYRFTNLNIDGYVGIFVALLIIWSGIGIIRDALRPLLGEAITPEVYDSITELVESYDGVTGTHDLIVHDYGPTKKMASIHAEVPASQNVLISHEIIDNIEHDCHKKLGIFLVIHMDPVDNDSTDVKYARSCLDEVMKEEGIDYQYHDFRIVKGKQNTNVLFDIVVPFKFKLEDEVQLENRISTHMKKKGRFSCIITFDRSFMKGN